MQVSAKARLCLPISCIYQSIACKSALRAPELWDLAPCTLPNSDIRHILAVTNLSNACLTCSRFCLLLRLL